MVQKKLCGAVSKKDVLKLKAMYEKLDPEGVGYVKIEKLLASLSRDGSGVPNQVLNIFMKLDNDGNGSLSFYEFLKGYYPEQSKADLTAMSQWAYPPKDNSEVRSVREQSAIDEDQLMEIKNIFLLYDTNGDGVLDRAELTEALTASGYEEEEIDSLFEECDNDGSNAVDFDEFVKMIQGAYM